MQGFKIQFGCPWRKSRKILFRHPTVLISPNSHHTPYYPNIKWTRLNATTFRRLLIIKVSSKKSSIKDRQNYSSIYMETSQPDFKLKQEPKRGLSQTNQISKPPQGGGYFLKSVMLHGADEVKLGDVKEVSYQKLIRSHKGGVTKVF